MFYCRCPYVPEISQDETFISIFNNTPGDWIVHLSSDYGYNFSKNKVLKLSLGENGRGKFLINIEEMRKYEVKYTLWGNCVRNCHLVPGKCTSFGRKINVIGESYEYTITNLCGLLS